MSIRLWKLVLAVVLALPLNGCMSAWGTFSQPSPYVGCRLSASYLVNTDLTQRLAWVIGILCVIDLPLTAVVDTLLLPLTLATSTE